MVAGADVAWVERGGIRLQVFHQGSGPVVVLPHGFPELAYSWRQQFGPLAEAGYTVVAPDQRGFGGSSCPPEIADYALDELAADAAAVIEAFGGKATVIGHDWGAPVAWHTALRYPTKVGAVGSLSVPHAQRAPGPPLELMRKATGDEFIHYVDYFQEPGLAEGEFEGDIRAALLGFLWSISGDAPREERFKPIRKGMRFLDSLTAPAELPAWLSEADLQTYVDAFERTGFRGGLNWYRNANRNWEASADLGHAKVQQPAMFVTGSRDPARNPAAMERLPEVVPNVRMSEVLDGCGHWTQQERPEDVTRLMLEFLRSLP